MNITGDFGALSIEVERIDVTTNLPRADHGWRFTDAAGHEHHWDDGYPTLRRVVDDTYWCDTCGEEETDSHLECPLCGEHIEPGLVYPGAYREFAPGRRRYLLDGVEISEERAEEIMAAYRSRSDG